MIARLRRSRRADVAELNITAFMNLMVALVPLIRAGGLRLLNGSAAIGEWPRQTDYAFEAVTEALVALKAGQPQEERITLLLEPDIPYDVLIRAMDAVHYQPPQDARSLTRGELFPKISVGDAPAAGAP
jgi:biopolymer transport protein ExbD